MTRQRGYGVRDRTNITVHYNPYAGTVVENGPMYISSESTTGQLAALHIVAALAVFAQAAIFQPAVQVQEPTGPQLVEDEDDE